MAADSYVGEDRPPTVEVVDELGNTLFSSSAEVARKMLHWLDLEASCGELTPGLAALRDQLGQEFENGVY